jgi:hypothetical protein
MTQRNGVAIHLEADDPALGAQRTGLVMLPS